MRLSQIAFVPGTGIEPVRPRGHRILSPEYNTEIFVFKGFAPAKGCKMVQNRTLIPHFTALRI